MVTTNTTAAANVYAAADAISAITAVLSDYADSCWTADGMAVVKRPPPDALAQCRHFLNKLNMVVQDLETTEVA